MLCGNSHGPFFYLEFLHGHGQYSDRLHADILRVCGEVALRTGRDLSPECDALIDRAYVQVCVGVLCGGGAKHLITPYDM